MLRQETTVISTLSSKFQLSIPKTVCEQKRWKAGQKFVFISKGKGFLAIPVPGISDLVGLAKGANPVNYRDR